MMSDIVERLRAAESRFHASYEQRGPDECWDWRGMKFRNGYGRFFVARTSITAHRAMRVLQSGPIPREIEVCHSCDNRACVNPGHLFLGTRKDNATDKVRKNRQARQFGEDNPSAKLTPADVEKVLRSEQPHRSLARRLGVSERLVRQIRKGQIWQRVREALGDG